MQEECVVSKKKGASVYIAVERSAKCNTCKACVFGKKQRIVLPALTEVACAQGDRVLVEMPKQEIKGAPFFLYAVPLLFIIGGILLGMLFNEIVQIILAFSALLLSIGMVYCIDRFFRRKKQFMPIIIENVSQSLQASAAQPGMPAASGGQSGGKGGDAETEAPSKNIHINKRQ